MKKYVTISFVYAIAAICCGVFYREITRILGYTGKTTLAFTHLHLFVLGTILFLLVALFSIHTDLPEQKAFKRFMVVYNVGLPFMVIMFFVRGMTQVLEMQLTVGATSAISGISGIAHIVMTVAIVLFFVALRNTTAPSAAHKS